MRAIVRRSPHRYKTGTIGTERRFELAMDGLL